MSFIVFFKDLKSQRRRDTKSLLIRNEELGMKKSRQNDIDAT